MSIASELARITTATTSIATAKAAIGTSIGNKGVTVPATAKLADFPDLIDSIVTGGSADFFECASVDTTAHTWTGYKWSLSNGEFLKDGEVTPGLTYTSVIPTVGIIYTEDALARIDFIYKGSHPISYIKLQSLSETDDNYGHTITYYTGGSNYNTKEAITNSGMLCTHFVGTNVETYNRKKYAEVSGIDFGETGVSLSAWVKDMRTGSNFIRFVSITDSSLGIFGGYANGSFTLYSGTASGTNLNTYSTGAYPNHIHWHHVVITSDGTNTTLYIDGVGQTPSAQTQDISTLDKISIGPDNTDSFEFCISNIRAYNYVLSQEEITDLAGEFAPTDRS